MSGSDDFDDVAAEYVLGILPPAEAEAARVRRTRDPAFAAEVFAWERKLAPLADLTRPEPAPDLVWARLNRATKPKSANVGVWQGLTASGYALAAGLAAVLLLRPAPPLPRPLAALTPFGAQPAAYVVEREPDGSLKLIAIAPVTVASGKDLQLWLVPNGKTVPVSLGVLPKEGADVAARADVGAGAQLLISLEPGGGSPTGQPTGPVLYGATVTAL